MEISPTGDGLRIALICDFIFAHDWMSYLSYYSITKNLPDASFRIICSRGGDIKRPLFRWAKMFKLNFIITDAKMDLSDYFIITPTIVALEAYNGKNLGPNTSKSDETSVFIDYSKGWAKFNTSEWINRGINPLSNTDSFYVEDMNVNEHRIGKMWNKFYKFYSSIN